MLEDEVTTYTVTTLNWNDVAFWNGISEVGSGHTLDFSNLPSSFEVDFNPLTNRITIEDGATVFVVGDADYSSGDAQLGGSTQLEYFTTIIGSQGDDTLLGGDGDDIIYGGSGIDSLIGGLGNDEIYGGEGSDTISGGLEGDTLFGGTGADYITGGEGPDEILGGHGDDTIDGGADDDILEGGDGNDTVSGGDGADVIYGDASSTAAITNGTFDTFGNILPAGWNEVGENRELVDGRGVLVSPNTGTSSAGAGATSGVQQDVATVAGQTYTLNFNVSPRGNTANYQGDQLFQVIVDGEVVFAKTALEFAASSYNNQSVTFEATSATTNIQFVAVNPTADATDMASFSVDDIEFSPFEGNDNLSGGAGDDSIFGGAGDDTLDGGADDDQLTGGDGSDLFVWDGASNDVITDFGTGNTGTVGDSGITAYNGDNDFVDLTGIFNAGTLAAYNAAAGTSFSHAYHAMNHDIADGVINFNGTELSGPTLTLTGVTALETDETGVTCFTRGALIETIKGEVAIEDLSVDDLVLTFDGSYKPIRWIGQRKVSAIEIDRNDKLRPICISAGALGCGQPRRDLVVSRQHRMYVNSPISKRMFRVQEVLISAIKLAEIPGIYVDDQIDEIEYFHLLFDQHEVIFAEGAATESFHTGPNAINALSRCAKVEIFSLFPELLAPQNVSATALMVPNGQQQKTLVARHVKNDKPMCQPKL